MKIIEAYQVPEGYISPDIFSLPCVSSAYKNMRGITCYNVESVVAMPTDWICKDKGGLWHVLSDKEYKEIGGEE